MKFTCLFLLVLVINSLCSPGQDMDVKIKDINKDGIKDTVQTFYDGGSGFGGYHCRIINGKTHEEYELDNYLCFCKIKKSVLIPPELRKPENILFLETIKKEILPEKREKPDESLTWIISGNLNNFPLDDHIFFEQIIKPESIWKTGEITLPGRYYIDLQGDTLNKLYSTDEEIPEWFSEKDNTGFLIYNGNNLSEMRSEPIASDSILGYNIFITSHSVMVRKGNLHKWVFITDYELTGAPDKLRWGSIGKVELADKYLLILQRLETSGYINIYVVNIETGVCGKIKSQILENLQSNPDSLVIKDGKILFSNNGQKTELILKNVFNELDAL